MTLLLATLLLASPVRREATPAFQVDDAFQADGGVQYSFSLEEAAPPEFVPLEPGASAKHPWVSAMRLVHTLDKDADFFSAERVVDVGYINAVGPRFQVTRLGPGRFHCARTPANDFTITHLGPQALASSTRDAAMDQVERLCGAGPDSVVVQHNEHFARVMGWRTAEDGFTWTAHYRLGPGRTRVCVLTMSYLVNVPPFFLGGRQRVHEQSLEEALALVEALRTYRP